jgi:hypothetical protein
VTCQEYTRCAQQADVGIHDSGDQQKGECVGITNRHALLLVPRGHCRCRWSRYHACSKSPRSFVPPSFLAYLPPPFIRLLTRVAAGGGSMKSNPNRSLIPMAFSVNTWQVKDEHSERSTEAGTCVVKFLCARLVWFGLVWG